MIMKARKKYEAPAVEVLAARVEKGFAGSGNRELYLGSEEDVGYNGGISFGGGPGGSSGNLESVGDGGAIYFFENWDHQYQPRIQTC